MRIPPICKRRIASRKDTDQSSYEFGIHGPSGRTVIVIRSRNGLPQQRHLHVFQLHLFAHAVEGVPQNCCGFECGEKASACEAFLLPAGGHRRSAIIGQETCFKHTETTFESAICFQSAFCRGLRGLTCCSICAALDKVTKAVPAWL